MPCGTFILQIIVLSFLVVFGHLISSKYKHGQYIQLLQCDNLLLGSLMQFNSNSII